MTSPSSTTESRRTNQPEMGSLPGIDISIIAPAHNEEENVCTLVEEIEAVINDLKPKWSIEAIIVNDGSTDRTEKMLLDLAESREWMRVLSMKHTPPGSGNGQSAAFCAAFRAARGTIFAPLDADLQNPPDNFPAMLELMERENADVVQGDRSANRQDSFMRAIATWTGRTFRRVVLGDTIRDTGCSLRLMKREVALALPLEFRGMHRFIPGTARRLGYKVVEIPVSHRARRAGISKYGLINRGVPGFFDLLAVRWMNNRRRPTVAEEKTVKRQRSSSGDDDERPSPSDTNDDVESMPIVEVRCASTAGRSMRTNPGDLSKFF